MSPRAEVYLCGVGQSKKFAGWRDNLFGGVGNVVRMRGMRKIMLFPLVLLFACQAGAQLQILTVQATGTNSNLRGVSIARISADKVAVWASGSNGVVLRSLDGGRNWKQLHVSDGDALDFRGIRAVNDNVAYVISSGEGDKSRIYKTTDGGETWELQYTDKRPAFFLDDIACFTEIHCFALADPIDGKFVVLSTEDGKIWQALPRDGMPEIISGEGAFAASGTSLAIYGSSDIYFGTGGGAKARVFHSQDSGRTWTVANTPLKAGNAFSGIFSIVRVKNTVIAVGGNYRILDGTSRVAAYSKDAGITWKLALTQPSGYRSGVASLYDSTLLCVGPNGEDISNNLGVTWMHIDKKNMNAITVFAESLVWTVGAKGSIGSAVFVK
jgi:photosystem II stability/assembly factor-like uncharacterized protein